VVILQGQNTACSVILQGLLPVSFDFSEKMALRGTNRAILHQILILLYPIHEIIRSIAVDSLHLLTITLPYDMLIS